MFCNYEFKVVAGPICGEDYVNSIVNMYNGSSVSFTGYVRARNFNDVSNGITFIVFEPLLLNVFRRLCFKIFTEYGRFIQIKIIHSKGFVKVGEPCIYIKVVAAHRIESFKVCRYIIENVKINAPIWKKEHYFDIGSSERWFYVANKLQQC
jgi:molybdopterin synthase catalytic subunit